MSADNWGVCPKCLATAGAKYVAAAKAIRKAYGKVPVEQFDKQRNALGEPPTADLFEPTLREDYEMGITQQSEFYVSYSGRCSECDFAHLFKHSEQLT